MRKVSWFASLLFATLPFSQAQAQDSIENKAAAANAAYQAKDWAKAEPLYEQLTQIQPETAAAGIGWAPASRRPESTRKRRTRSKKRSRKARPRPWSNTAWAAFMHPWDKQIALSSTSRKRSSRAIPSQTK